MQLKVTGHHLDVTPSLRQYASTKMQRIERHCDQLVDAHIIFTVEKLRHKAEATLGVSGGQIYADAVEDDMYAAIDILMDRLDRQVKKHKEKTTDHHAKRAQKSAFPAE